MMNVLFLSLAFFAAGLLKPDAKGVITATAGAPLRTPTWMVQVPRAGRYEVQVRYAATAPSAGAVYTITMKGAMVGMTKGIVEDTGNHARTLPVGDMELDPGNYLLYLQPEYKAGQPPLKLEWIQLRRVGD